jgi:hypothetical protein
MDLGTSLAIVALVTEYHRGFLERQERVTDLEEAELELEEEEEEEAHANNPPITHIQQHDWSMDDPGDHFFHDDNDFVQYLRQARRGYW